MTDVDTSENQPLKKRSAPPKLCHHSNMTMGRSAEITDKNQRDLDNLAAVREEVMRLFPSCTKQGNSHTNEFRPSNNARPVRRGSTNLGFSFADTAGTESSSSQSSDNESPNTVMWEARPTRRSSKSNRRGSIAVADDGRPKANHEPSRSIPVRRRRVADPEQEDIEEMTRLYDMRTWEMYLRITEARKRSASPAAAASISHHQPIRQQQQPTAPKITSLPTPPSDEREDDLDPELCFGDLDDC